MISIRNEDKSFWPLSYELIGPRTRNILMIFLVFYLVLIMAAFASLAAGMLKASINSIIPMAAVLLAGIFVGLMIYKMKLNPFVGTVAGIVLIAAGVYSDAYLPVSVPDVNIWLVVLLLLCLIAALTPIWSFTQPTIYMFFYVVFFGLVALIISLITGLLESFNPCIASFHYSRLSFHMI